MKLSVNLNKVCLLRNSRGGSNPAPLWAAERCLEAGAQGVTLHLREDRRHTVDRDVEEIAQLCRRRGVEFNLEGDARAELLEIALRVRPAQLTLVPVTPGEITSDHGWDLPAQAGELAPALARAKEAGIRTSIFLDADAEKVPHAARTGADRIEIYTEPYAAAFGSAQQQQQLDRVMATAQAAEAVGLGVNAGHDLTCENLQVLAKNVPQLQEVSIGHALIAEALYVGLEPTVRRYLDACAGLSVPPVRTQ